tara:strand:- start:4826 stop:6541 length:1716 start_codon:yes stop_codon:yes gene_type:complete
MAYKVFFAYQTDTDDKFNKGFIHQAGLNAIQKLKDEGFDIEFDYGFNKTSGNPILINEMLKKNDEADLVLVDLTFTSSKSGFGVPKINLFGHTIQKYKIEEDKFSPNPNVLLETGYAWSGKGQYRTLTVMNTAFGVRSELPVDLKSFRWPIDYHLNEANYKDRKSVRKSLTEDLYKAFKNSLIAEASYQIEKWSPFKINAQLKSQHSYPFKLTTGIKTIISDLRNMIDNYRGPIRICGVEGVGKSRIVYEVFHKHDDLPFDENVNKVLYYDLLGTNYTDISKQVAELGLQNQHKIIVIDNCEYEVHRRLSNDFKNKNVKLITIKSVDNNSEQEHSNFFIDKNVALDLNEVLLEERFQGAPLENLLEITKGNLNATLPIIESDIANEDTNKNLIELYELIISEESFKNGAIEVIGALEFINHVRISGEFNNDELENFQSTFFPDLQIEQLRSIIEELLAKKLVTQKGDFVITKLEHRHLFDEWFVDKDISSILKSLDYRFVSRFLNNIDEIFDDGQTENLAKLLFNEENGLLNDDEFFNTPKALLIQEHFTVKKPILVLENIEHNIDKVLNE